MRQNLTSCARHQDNHAPVGEGDDSKKPQGISASPSILTIDWVVIHGEVQVLMHQSVRSDMDMLKKLLNVITSLFQNCFQTPKLLCLLAAVSAWCLRSTGKRRKDASK